MNWTAEAKAELTRLWELGWETTPIAEHLGVTKNAVCGMVRRLNLPQRRAGSHGRIMRGNGVVAFANRVRAKSFNHPRHPCPSCGELTQNKVCPRCREAAVAKRKLTIKQQAALAQRPPAAPSAPPAGVPLTSAGTCQWPLTDGKPWRFCGEPAVVGCSWCAEHKRLASSRGGLSIAVDPLATGPVFPSPPEDIEAAA